MNTVRASAGGGSTPARSRFDSDSDSLLINAALAAAGSAPSRSRPSPGDLFKGKTEAVALRDADLTRSGAVSDHADSTEFITADAVGIAGSGTVSVSARSS
jgi:hypothetical protein